MSRTVPGPTDHVVVVGAGLSGLAATLHLLGTGRRVTVLERANRPGGRAGRAELDGFHVDTGPTVLTMPELVAEALAAVGESLEDRLDLIRLDPAYRARFADGSELHVHTDGDRMEEEVRRFSGARDAAGYRELRRWLTALYDAEIDRFIGSNFDSPLDLLAGPAAARDLARLVGLRGFGRLGPQIARFLGDERLQRVFSFQSLYAGVAPRRALGAYGVIAYMDTVAGVYFPRGGMHAVPRALADAATAAGAEIRYGAPVDRLELAGGRCRAVHTADGTRIAADAVVLTADLPEAHRILGRVPRRPVPLRWAPSAVVLHAGMPAVPGLAHHTISFGAAWDTTFDEILHCGRLMSDPSLLVTRPTASDPTLAPAGHDLVYVLAPCPNLAVGDLDWARIGPAYRDELVGILAARLDLPTTTTVEHLVTPADWAAQGLAVGTPFSAAHTFAQTGPMRSRNLPRGAENVVLAGCGTTPGVGIPPVLISGRLAAARITGPPGRGTRADQRFDGSGSCASMART